MILKITKAVHMYKQNQMNNSDPLKNWEYICTRCTGRVRIINFIGTHFKAFKNNYEKLFHRLL